jgi:hypothetical protein
MNLAPPLEDNDLRIQIRRPYEECLLLILYPTMGALGKHETLCRSLMDSTHCIDTQCSPITYMQVVGRESAYRKAVNISQMCHNTSGDIRWTCIWRQIYMLSSSQVTVNNSLIKKSHFTKHQNPDFRESKNIIDAQSQSRSEIDYNWIESPNTTQHLR